MFGGHIGRHFEYILCHISNQICLKCLEKNFLQEALLKRVLLCSNIMLMVSYINFKCLAAILAAILNISKCSMMTEWHHSFSEKGHHIEQVCAKTFCAYSKFGLGGWHTD